MDYSYYYNKQGVHSLPKWSSPSSQRSQHSELLFARVKWRFIETEKNGVSKNSQYLTERKLLQSWYLIIIITVTNTFWAFMIQTLSALACNDTRCEVAGEHDILQLCGHSFHQHTAELYKKTSSLPFAMTLLCERTRSLLPDSSGLSKNKLMTVSMTSSCA